MVAPTTLRRERPLRRLDEAAKNSSSVPTPLLLPLLPFLLLEDFELLPLLPEPEPAPPDTPPVDGPLADDDDGPDPPPGDGPDPPPDDDGPDTPPDDGVAMTGDDGPDAPPDDDGPDTPPDDGVAMTGDEGPDPPPDDDGPDTPPDDGVDGPETPPVDGAEAGGSSLGHPQAMRIISTSSKKHWSAVNL